MYLFHEDLVFLDVEKETNEQVIKYGAKKLFEAGIVKDTYLPFVLEREKEAPTGIPTDIIKVSLPHTDAEHVIKPGAVFMQLKKPVTFTSMEDLETPLDVELVFQLALTDGRQQIEALKSLMKLFYDADKLVKLKNANSVSEVMEILRDIQI